MGFNGQHYPFDLVQLSGDPIVGIATRLCARRNRVRFLVGTKDFFLLQNNPFEYGVQPASYSTDTKRWEGKNSKSVKLTSHLYLVPK